jgi:hypothetical protein
MPSSLASSVLPWPHFARSKFNPAAVVGNMSHPALHPRYCHGCISPAQSFTIQPETCSDRYCVYFSGGHNLVIKTGSQRPPTYGGFWKLIPSTMVFSVLPWLRFAAQSLTQLPTLEM